MLLNIRRVKKMKRIISLILATIMIWSGGIYGTASAYAQSLPQVIEQGEGFELFQNANGSNTVKFYGGGGSDEAVSWSAAGDAFSVEGANRSLTLNKVYRKDQTLLTDTFGDIGIAFAPLMNDQVTLCWIKVYLIPHPLWCQIRPINPYPIYFKSR